jgi:8-amino-3,8-dideoxy-alpha-D-manno-octulosonate transaminase
MADSSRQPARSRGDLPMYPGGMLIDEEEEREVLDVLRTRRLFRYYGPQPGPSKVEELEQLFASQTGVNHALAVTSGTAALVCALQGVGVGPGDEVILPAYTWIASASAIAAVGAVPVLAEVDESLTIDPVDLERKITPHTRAVIPVHMRGVPCRMDAVMAAARRHNLMVVEDCAQADGASYRGRRLGSWGDAGCFSFQFNKILTSGEGGMVTTNLDEVWKRAVMFHDVIGGLRNQVPTEEILWGINFRMPELLAAVMLVQVRRLEGLLEAMRTRKRMLAEGLAGMGKSKGISLQQVPDPAGDASVALIFFAPEPAAAKRICTGLAKENIGASVLYEPDRSDYHIYAHWSPIMLQKTWTEQGGPWQWAKRDIRYSQNDCPRSLELLGRAVHLDVNPLYTNQDIEETLEGLSRVLKEL